MSAPLSIRLLGEFAVQSGGRPVAITADRLQSLLTYLLLRRTGPQPRARLAFELWPDSGESQARSNLRNLIHSLRQVLPDADRYLQVDANTIGWRIDAAYTLDLAAFEDALAAAERSASEEEERAFLQAAVDAYGGDLLPGVHDEWLLPHREELRQTYLDALQELVRLEEQAGELRAALRLNQQLLRDDPLNEAAHVQMMRLYALAGDRAGVRRAFQACAAALQRELGIEPSPYTQRAYEDYLRMEPPSPRPARSPHRGAPEDAPPAEERGEGMDVGARQGAPVRGEGMDVGARHGAPVRGEGMDVGARHGVPVRGEGGYETGGYEVEEVAPPPRLPRPLPAQPTPFLGRTDEAIAIAELLADPACRLLTIAGPGGIGKTRLALHTAAAHAGVFADGVAYVALSPVEHADALPAAVAAALNYSFVGAVEPPEQLLRFLADKELLLVLDNLDELLDEGLELVTALLDRAPAVKVVVTSRERLTLQEEWVYDLDGLPLPGRGRGSLDIENAAVALFLQSARRVDSSFTPGPQDARAIHRICRLVEGMPLGLELAASWVRTLSVDEIAAEIERSLDFLASSLRNLPARHRSMRAVFDHSWRGLSPLEQQTLRRLAVFRGGFHRDAAAEVAGATLPLLLALVDKSLVRRSGPARYDLHELVRQYAAGHLAEDPDEQAAVLARHSAYFTAFLAARQLKLRSHAQTAVLEEMSTEFANLRAAWDWAAACGRLPALEPAADVFYHFFELRSRFREGVDLFDRAVEAMGPPGDPAGPHTPAERQRLTMLGALLGYGGWFTYRAGEDESVALDKALRGAALLRAAGADRALSDTLMFIGHITTFAGDPQAARPILEEALAMKRILGLEWGAGMCLLNLGMAAGALDEHAEAFDLLQESLEQMRSVGDQRGIAIVLGMLGSTAERLGRYAEGRAMLLEALEVAETIHDRWVTGICLDFLGVTALAMEQPAEAHAYFVRAHAILKDSERWRAAQSVYHLAQATLALRRAAEAAPLFRQAAAAALEAHTLWLVYAALAGLAQALRCCGQAGRAAELAGYVAAASAAPAAVAAQARALLAEHPSPSAAYLVGQPLETVVAQAQFV